MKSYPRRRSNLKVRERLTRAQIQLLLDDVANFAMREQINSTWSKIYDQWFTLVMELCHPKTAWGNRWEVMNRGQKLHLLQVFINQDAMSPSRFAEKVSVAYALGWTLNSFESALSRRENPSGGSALMENPTSCYFSHLEDLDEAKADLEKLKEVQ